MRCALYRQYNELGDPLYIGISKNPVGRQAQHMRGSPWADDVAKITLEWFDDEPSAIIAECAAIEVEQPIHNVRKGAPLRAEKHDRLWRSRLAEAVEKSGRSKRDVSSSAGLGSGYVHSILSEGKDPTVSNMLRICAALGVRVESILADTAGKPAQTDRGAG